MKLLIATLMLCPYAAAQDTGSATVQGTCNATNTGNSSTVTVTCYNVDKRLADRISQLVAASKRDGKTLKDISDKLDQLLKQATGEPPSGSINQNNSGGINVQQGTTGRNSPIINSPITIGDLPKTIEPHDMEVLKAFFRSAPNKGKIMMSADQFSGTQPLPSDFYDALKGGGWNMVETGVSQIIGFGPPGRRFQGAIVTVKGEPLGSNEVPKLDPSDPVSYIGQALGALRVSHILRRDPTLEEGLIIIGFEGGFPR